MTLGTVYQIATDGELRLLAGFASPPRAGVVVGTLPSGQVEVELDDVDGGTVAAWPLNGFSYSDGAVVYVVFASDSADSGIVVGAKTSGYVGRLRSMTTAQRDALTAVAGMIIYNSTTSKIEAYAGGAWVALH